jgi:hypothetical protein
LKKIAGFTPAYLLLNGYSQISAPIVPDGAF